MKARHNPTPDAPTFEDIERVIQRARRMRSQALADLGAAVGSAVKRRMHCALVHIRAVVSGNIAEKCA